MYHDDFGFDALPLPSPLDRPLRGGLWAQEQDYSGKLIGVLLASDLFGVRSAGARPLLQDALLATCWPDVDIRYSGEQLDQDDLDVLLGVLLLVFTNPGRSTGAVRFQPRDLIRRIHGKGRRLTARTVERALWRLSSGGMTIASDDGQIKIQTRLVHGLFHDAASGVFALEINPRLLEGFHSATGIERLLATREPLGAAAFPRWLAGLLANASSCLCLEMDGLRRLSGLTHQAMPAFRERAESALQIFSDLGYIVSMEAIGPDRLVVNHQVARGEQSACLLVR